MKTTSSLTSPSIPFVLAIFGQKWPKKLDKNKMNYKKTDIFPVHLPIGSSQNLPNQKINPASPVGFVFFVYLRKSAPFKMAKRPPVKPVGSDQPKEVKHPGGANSKIPRPALETVLEDIFQGLSYRAMASKYGMSLTVLFDFLHLPEHSARVKEARKTSADMDSDRAEQVLIESEGTMAEVTRARELAQFYKWRASKKNPATYADNTKIEHSGEIRTPEPPPIVFNISPEIAKEVMGKTNE